MFRNDELHCINIQGIGIELIAERLIDYRRRNSNRRFNVPNDARRSTWPKDDDGDFRLLHIVWVELTRSFFPPETSGIRFEFA